jgi:undecaprenyl-diphosphatase
MKVRGLIYANIISLILFLLILISISYNSHLISLDSRINLAIPTIQNSFLILISKILSIAFDTTTLIIISLLLSIYLWLKKSRKDSIFLALTMILSAGAIYLLKELLQRVRPSSALIPETGFSFPSGHAAIAVVFLGILSYFFLKSNKTKIVKIWTLIISAILVLIISFSRIYLNLHWLSDVLAGLALGFVLLSGGLIILQICFRIKPTNLHH